MKDEELVNEILMIRDAVSQLSNNDNHAIVKIIVMAMITMGSHVIQVLEDRKTQTSKYESLHKIVSMNSNAWKSIR